MATRIRTLLIASLLIGATAALAAGRAEVNFREPARFADAGFGAVERERTLRVLTAHIERLAARLPAGQSLRIDVLDVDLAGRINHFLPSAPRVVGRGVDVPKIVLRYELREGSKVLQSGEEHLVDLGYQFSLPSRYDNDALRFERRMLNEWFEDRFRTQVAGLR